MLVLLDREVTVIVLDVSSDQRPQNSAHRVVVLAHHDQLVELVGEVALLLLVILLLVVWLVLLLKVVDDLWLGVHSRHRLGAFEVGGIVIAAAAVIVVIAEVIEINVRVLGEFVPGFRRV